MILSNFTYPMEVKPHRVFSPWEKIPRQIENFKKQPILFERILKFKYKL